MENSMDKYIYIKQTLDTDGSIHISNSEFSKDFPFLYDETVECMSRIRVMFIMRGLPGTGKTTIVNRIKFKFPAAMSCSADDYFIQDGVYTFDKARLQEAHEMSHQLAHQLATNGTPVIIIDNTNLRHRYMRVYFDIAKENHYVVVIVSPKTDWANDLEQLVIRNKRNLTLPCLEKRLKLYKEIFPIYWGWFFNDNEHTCLTDLAEKYFPVCLQNVPELYRYLRYHVKDDKELTFDALYNNGKKPVPGRQLHCTAFYAGPNGQDNPDVVKYANRKAVQESIGKSGILTVVGIFITPRTVGARVCLTTEQLEVWKSDPIDQISFQKRIKDHLNSGHNLMTKDIQDAHEAQNTLRTNTSNIAHSVLENPVRECSALSIITNNTISTQCDGTRCEIAIRASDSILSQCLSEEPVDDWILLDTSDMPYPNMFVSSSEVTTDSVTKTLLIGSDESSHIEPLPPGSRAHMTLGCAEGIQAVQTGFDLLDILGCEKLNEIIGEPFHIDDALLSYYGEGRCTVYFDNPCYIRTIFSGNY